VRGNLFQINGQKAEPLVLPEGQGPPVTLSEKVYVPIKEHPDVSSARAGERRNATNWMRGRTRRPHPKSRRAARPLRAH